MEDEKNEERHEEDRHKLLKILEASPMGNGESFKGFKGGVHMIRFVLLKESPVAMEKV